MIRSIFQLIYLTYILTGKTVNAFDSLFVGWPSVTMIDNNQYHMYYHTYDAVSNRFVDNL